ncbi:interstitial collagenase [Aplochiton taeniatus]
MCFQAYLKNFYGYRSRSGRQMRAAPSGADEMEELQAKLKEMQCYFGLQPTGELTGETLAAMRRPRCGLSDVEPFGETLRWRNRILTYRISSYSSAMRDARARKAFRRAWKIWADVTTLRFRRRSRGNADIEISFYTGDHEDGSPFDGDGGVLAHAFLPGPDIGGDVHFDLEEDWTFNGTGFDLFAVAVHEFGHALGLPHSSDPGAIMYPSYNFVPHEELQLSFQDVADVQSLYGINSNVSSLLKRPPPKTPYKCDQNLTFDAVTELQQEIIFFKDRFMWRTHPNFDDIRINLMTSLWPDGVPSYIDAAYENVEMNKMVFFKGSQYWAVHQLKLLEGFPRNISDMGFPLWVQSVDAALHFRAARLTVFFVGHECWRYDEEQMKMDEGSPQSTAQLWPGVPTPFDAAVLSEGFVYFFKGNVQYKYDPKHKYVISTSPSNEFLDCKEESSNDTLMNNNI